MSPFAVHSMGWADAASPRCLGTAKPPDQAVSACGWWYWALIFLPSSFKKDISTVKAM